MARKNTFNMGVDFNEVTDIIGAIRGIDDVAETSYYIDDLLRVGHAIAAEQFDIDTAAAAAAGHHLNHMYEWGTAGINRGEGMAMNPLSKAAQLWVHRFGGRNGKRSIDFEFKPSVIPVPLPTPQSSGIPAEELQKGPFRRHVFHWKAPVMELGLTVHIRPDQAKALWVPVRPGFFIFTKKTLTVVPGRRLAGNFTTHWLGWWSATGLDMINGIVQGEFQGDLDAAIKAANASTPRRYKSPTKKSYTLDIGTARDAAERVVRGRARARNRKIPQEVDYNKYD